jgi:predicted metal-dependent hydrolase
MERKVRHKNSTITYTMKTFRRSKRIRVIVHRGGDVVLTRPYWVTVQQAERFLMEKIEWLVEKIELMKRRRRNPLLGEGSERQYRAMKDDVLRMVERRLRHFNRFYGFEYAKVTIRNQKTRWGSCSRQGNLSFNYKLGLLPPRCADYIIVHELCHLKEFNHSKRFWNLVAQTVPDHEEIREEINRLTSWKE